MKPSSKWNHPLRHPEFLRSPPPAPAWPARGMKIAVKLLPMKSPQPNNLSVLVIDDDPRVAGILVETLEEEGFTAAKSFSAGEGYKKYVTGEFQALLVDEALGKAKGLHLIRLIRLLDRKTTLILISGVADLNAAVAALRGGADDFISKPFKPWDLKPRIQTALNRRSLVSRKGRVPTGELERKGEGDPGFAEEILEGLPAGAAAHLARLVPAIEKHVLRLPGFAGQVAEKATEAARRLSVREGLLLSLGRAAALQVLGVGGWEPVLARETLLSSRHWQDSWRSILLEGAEYLEALEGKDGRSARILRSAAAPAGGDLHSPESREEEILGHLLLLATFFTAASAWGNLEEAGTGDRTGRRLLEKWEEEPGIRVDAHLAHAFF